MHESSRARVAVGECTLAITKDPSSDPKSFPYYTVHFVNGTSERIVHLWCKSGGFTTSDDELIEATGTRKDKGSIEPGAVSIIGHEDAGSFDFAIFWNIDACFEGERTETLHYSVPKDFPCCSDGPRWEYVPALGVEAYVARSERE
ncbi:MAG: hypothetical protein ABI895_11455 [Deltaproteobacteria bacterium]